ARQGLTGLPEVAPGVRLREIADVSAERELAGLEPRLDVLPGERLRVRCAGPAPDRIRRDDRLREAVSERVEIDAALARGNPRLHGEQLGERLRELPAEGLGEREDVVRVGAPLDRHEDVEPL